MSSVQPYEKVRAIFAGHFYRMISPENEDFIISPAAVLKLLMTIALGTNDRLADQIHWDLHIKHIDEARLVDEANREGIWDMGFSMEVRERLENELSGYIQQEVLLDFFKNDFSELGGSVVVKNFIISDGSLEFKQDYLSLIEHYFKTVFLHRNQADELQLLDTKFLKHLSDKSLDLFGSVSFKFSLPKQFVMHEDGTFEAFGSFKYKELENTNSLSFRAQTLEIPLECDSTVPLKMLVFIPNDFETLLKQSIGRDYTDFNKISEKLERKLVKVKLPPMKIERNTELSSFLAETSYRGLREFLNESVILDRMFENAADTKLHFGKYLQHTSLELFAPKAEISVENKSLLEPDVVYDATKQTFLYVIKSDKVIYVIGHYVKEN